MSKKAFLSPYMYGAFYEPQANTARSAPESRKKEMQLVPWFLGARKLQVLNATGRQDR
jgi:hypothetical protein